MIQQVLPLFADLNGKGAQDGTEIYWTCLAKMTMIHQPTVI